MHSGNTLQIIRGLYDTNPQKPKASRLQETSLPLSKKWRPRGQMWNLVSNNFCFYSVKHKRLSPQDTNMYTQTPTLTRYGQISIHYVQ